MFDVNSFVSKNFLKKLSTQPLSARSYFILLNLLLIGRKFNVSFLKKFDNFYDLLRTFDIDKPNLFTPSPSGNEDISEDNQKLRELLVMLSEQSNGVLTVEFWDSYASIRFNNGETFDWLFYNPTLCSRFKQEGEE